MVLVLIFDPSASEKERTEIRGVLQSEQWFVQQEGPSFTVGNFNRPEIDQARNKGDDFIRNRSTTPKEAACNCEASNRRGVKQAPRLEHDGIVKRDSSPFALEAPVVDAIGNPRGRGTRIQISE
jgi:hypothetical protein